MTDYATKHRPQGYQTVIGHKAAISSLRRFRSSSYPHTMLFVGPSGVGKTTLARIFAKEVGCHANDLREVNAANFTGVDAWREVLNSLAYAPKSGNVTVVIVDECHMLSKQAWNSLLKDTEEPPAHVFWVFCTTEAAKVPKTIRTRAHEIVLERVGRADLRELVAGVCGVEEIALLDGAMTPLLEYADGSPRQALTGLAMIAGAETVDQVRELLQEPGETSQGVELSRLLYGRTAPTWAALMKVLKAMDSPNAEGLRREVEAYGTKVVMNPKAGPEALSVLEQFSTPYPAGCGLGPLLISLARVVYES